MVKPAKAEGEPARTPGPPGAARTHTGAPTLVIALGMVLVASSAGASRVSTSAAVPLPCKEALAEGSAQVIPRLDSGYKVVLGKLALPTGSALQAGPSGESDPGARLFAKAGLVVKSGAEFELAVPRRWQGRLAIGWGPMRRTVRLRVAGCNSPGKSWLIFAGGYWVADPGCVSLVVKSAHRVAHVRIGVAIPCPGQRPVPADAPNVTDGQ